MKPRQLKTYFKFSLLLAVCCFLATGCSYSNYRNIERPEPPLRSNTPAPYKLDSGDTISIKFFHNKELNEENLLVRPDGKISLQLVGDITAKGSTVEELRQTLKERYKELLTFPEIAVIVRSIHKKVIYVGGEVVRPGEYIDDRGVNPLQAILMAGGDKKTANLSSVIILRETKKDVMGYYIVDLRKDLKELNNYRNIQLQEYDVVFVPPSGISEVNRFIELYVSRMLPSWFNAGLHATYEMNSDIGQ